MREALRSARRFLKAQAFKNYIVKPYGPLAAVTDSDRSLDEYIRDNAATSSHPVGTAAMSAKTASYGVVDPDLRVKGISGLRIVDGSVLVSFSWVYFNNVSHRSNSAIRPKWTYYGSGLCCCRKGG